MFSKWKVVCTLLAVGALSLGASADITVGFDPVDTTIPTIGGTANVNIVADIPQSNAIEGWGIDLTELVPSVASWALLSIGSSFTAVATPDGDGLAGLVPADHLGQQGYAWGNGIVLATIQFTATANGVTPLQLSNTPGDLTEGFALDPTGFATVHYNTGTVTVPEPAALTLLALAGLVALRKR